MGTIANINIRYKDLKMTGLINKIRTGRFINKKTSPILKKFIIKDINLKNLKKKNILFHYSQKTEKNSCSLTDVNVASHNQIIFKNNGNTLITDVKDGLSIMMFCKKKKIASAINLSGRHFSDYDPLKELLNYGFANFSKIIQDEPCTANISGGYVVPGLLEYQDYRLTMNREQLKIVAPFLLKRGFTINTIDLGGDYAEQLLNMITGEYTLKINNLLF